MNTSNKYQLIRKLAEGGMAEVFLAKCTGPSGFEKTLVVKRILPRLAANPDVVNMFLNEAKLAARLNHSNVVQIFDFGQLNGSYFIAMEYVDGVNLGTLARRARAIGAPIPLPIVARLVSLACEGLAYAHELVDPESGQKLNLVHRDISPDNLILSRAGLLKVLDFGIAKAMGGPQLTAPGMIKGKFAYMAPEMFRQQSVDLRSDVYALGVVLYELVTGKKPFEAAGDVNLIRAILTEPMIPLDQRRPDVPAELQRIIAKALEKNRETRYQSCRELQVDLEAFITSTGYQQPMPSLLAELVARLEPSAQPPAPPQVTQPPPFEPEELSQEKTVIVSGLAKVAIEVIPGPAVPKESAKPPYEPVKPYHGRIKPLRQVSAPAEAWPMLEWLQRVGLPPPLAAAALVLVLIIAGSVWALFRTHSAPDAMPEAHVPALGTTPSQHVKESAQPPSHDVIDAVVKVPDARPVTSVEVAGTSRATKGAPR